jgi:xylulokinase
MQNTAHGRERFVLAIDMGSTSLKAAVVSNQGEVAASALRPIATDFLPDGGAEQNPEEWWRAAIDACKEALTRADVGADRIIAVACTTMWAVTVAVDRDGNAIWPALTWMDTRGGPHARAIADGWPKVAGYDARKLARWVRLTAGAPTLSGVDGLGHVLFLKHGRPDVYSSAHKFLEPMDYLNLRLTGRMVATAGTIFPYWVTDNRNAGRVEYQPSLLRMAGIERGKMPDLIPVNSIVGTLKPEVASELGLRPETRVVTAASDSAAATIGAGAVCDYDGYFYIGTSSWLSCHVPWKKTDVFHSIFTMPAALRGKYMVGAEQGVAGRALDFLKDNLLFPKDDESYALPDDVYGYLNRLAASVPAGSDRLVFTPWINGVLAPSEDPCTRSAFFNQSLRTTRAHYVRAVMEGVLFNIRWVRDHVEKFIGRRFEQLAFIGGAAVSDLWCGIAADILGIPVRQIANPRSANAVGVAMAAFAALEEVAAEDIPPRIRVAALYHPRPENRRVYDEQYAAFLEFYKRTKRLYARMNPLTRSNSHVQ